MNGLVNSRCSGIYIIINIIIVLRLCEELGLELYLLLKSKSLWEFDRKLTKKLIIYYLLLILNIKNYKKFIYLILIILLDNYNFILNKL